ncbi:chromatin assembly factor 1 subunit rlf2-like [Anneissia japonica]|uniref:chromatin assembly factor 1 subunit rlf2-like n=1 Tax=Anneissia japonica TaxID=1529436 RepID=UPI001425A7D1|nr:chromatin assembly factor 1 subunit rlf2-like [Anneissia japonica]
MSELAYHWEALRRQRVIDRKHAAIKRMEEEKAQQEKARAEEAHRNACELKQQEERQKRELSFQFKSGDKAVLKKSYRERERTIQRLQEEREWHNEMIQHLEKRERQDIYTDMMRDHKHKSKVLRDHGIYRGDPKFFIDPQYA